MDTEDKRCSGFQSFKKISLLKIVVYIDWPLEGVKVEEFFLKTNGIFCPKSNSFLTMKKTNCCKSQKSVQGFCQKISKLWNSFKRFLNVIKLTQKLDSWMKRIVTVQSSFSNPLKSYLKFFVRTPRFQNECTKFWIILYKYCDLYG